MSMKGAIREYGLCIVSCTSRALEKHCCNIHTGL